MGPESSPNTVKITIRGSQNSAARAVQARLGHPDLTEVLRGLGVDSAAPVVIECKNSNKEVALEVRRDSVRLSIPARGPDPEKVAQSAGSVLIGYAVTQRLLDAAESFADTGIECPTRAAELDKLVKLYRHNENQPRLEQSVVLARALAPHRKELERRKDNLADKLKTLASLSADTLVPNTEAFCQKVSSFRAVAGVLRDTTTVTDIIVQKIKERLVGIEDLFAHGVYRGEHQVGKTVFEAMELLQHKINSAGWFKELPRGLHAAQFTDDSDRIQQLLLNSSMWNGSESSPGGSAASSRVTSREMVANGVANMMAELRYALDLDIESRQVSGGPELGFDLLEDFIPACLQVPAVVTTLGPESGAEQLSELAEFFRILLRIKYCEQPATKNFYEYVVYGVIPNAGKPNGEPVRVDVAVSPNFLVLQYVALIATSEPSVASERLKAFQEELLLIAIRSINAVRYEYRTCLAAHLKNEQGFDQHSLGVVVSDLEAMEKGMQLILNYSLEGSQSYGFGDLLNSIKALRESYSKVGLLGLSDTELAARVDEVLALNHSGPYSDQLREVTKRLQDRMKAYAGTKVEEATVRLQSLSQGMSIIPIVEYAQEILSLTKADPTSEVSASLRTSVGEALLEMLKVLEEYYCEEISRASKQNPSVEDVYRSLEAMHHLLIESSFVRDKLSPYADQLPPLLISKSQVLAEETPRGLKRSLSAQMRLLEEVVQNLSQDISSADASVRERATSCIQGLRWLRVSRSSFSEPVRAVYDRLVGKRPGT